MNWFINWFNSPYYHILYKNRDEKEAHLFIDNLMSYCQIPKASKLLDVACGKGRHAIYFNKKGLDVIGIDLSKNSINIANESTNSTLKFKVHDMRNVFLKNKFEVVVNLFTSFGYFENDNDDQRALNAMSSNLKKEGLLIIDFMNVTRIIKNLIICEEKNIEGVNFKIRRNFKDNYITKNISFIDNLKTYHFKETVKALTLNDFSKYIANAGLEIIDVFGSYNLQKFNEENSERLIIICKK